MKRIIIREHKHIPPFDEPARELRILNKPLWLHQRDLLTRYAKETALEVDSLEEAYQTSEWQNNEEVLIYKDNLFFNANLIDTFIADARASGRTCQIAFAKDDKTITTHALPLQDGIRLQGEVYVADIYYSPDGPRQSPEPLVIDTQPYEMGYYHIPSYMVATRDLVYQIPARAFLSIESWVHIFLASIPMGVFSEARLSDELMGRGRLHDILHWKKGDWYALKPKVELVLTAWWERVNPFEEQWRNHFFACKKLVKVGKNCSIDPTAIIHGPTTIGDNVYIGPGAVITNSVIGNSVNVMQGAQVMLSVISDRCFLPFNSAVFMSSMMENCMIAQNTCLQLGVLGRNTFLGANSVFTDFNLDGRMIRTVHNGELQEVGLAVIGSAIGHHCKIGSGFLMFPGRMIGSNTTIYYGHDNPIYRKCINVPGIPDAYNVSPSMIENEKETGESPQNAVYEWPRVVSTAPDKPDEQVHHPEGERYLHAPDDSPPVSKNSMVRLPPTTTTDITDSFTLEAHQPSTHVIC